MDAEKLELKVKPQELPGRKRVAHEVKHTEVYAIHGRHNNLKSYPIFFLISLNLGTFLKNTY